MFTEKSALLDKIKAYMKDDTSDEAISIVEDVSDTIDELTSRSSEDWKSKFDENDRMWRERYMKRFSEPISNSNVTTPEQVIKDNEEDIKNELEDVTFDNLFEEREG